MKFVPPKAVLLFIKSVESLKFLNKEEKREFQKKWAEEIPLYIGWEEGDKDRMR